VSTAPLEALIRAQKALIVALDTDDADGIARCTAAVDEVLLRIRALKPRFTGADAKALAEEAMALTETARVRVNLLADIAARRLARLAAATGKGKATQTYGRTGRLAF
jgi:orotidine-5'-phosphate decarboxylase